MATAPKKPAPKKSSGQPAAKPAAKKKAPTLSAKQLSDRIQRDTKALLKKTDTADKKKK